MTNCLQLAKVARNSLMNASQDRKAVTAKFIDCQSNLTALNSTLNEVTGKLQNTTETSSALLGNLTTLQGLFDTLSGVHTQIETAKNNTCNLLGLKKLEEIADCKDQAKYTILLSDFALLEDERFENLDEDALFASEDFQNIQADVTSCVGENTQAHSAMEQLGCGA
ncbi:MAG: hypothetical protein K0T99_01880 [Alphaproteobacteria bacterium]|nr:hypothetical protein [Alphaproteobacteria bacterium]